MLVTLPLQLIWLVIGFSCVVHVLMAKVRILRQKGKVEIDLFFGLAKLVAWNPIEGVVIMRNKSFRLVDDNPDDGGGMTVIYPALGDELAIRVPLELQVLEFKDQEVLTKEFIPLKIRGTIRWRIENLELFYLRVGDRIDGLTDRREHFDEKPSDRPKLEVAKQTRLFAFFSG